MQHTPESLEELLDVNGADLEQWPQKDAAQQARTLAMCDPVFRQSLDRARKLDQALNGYARNLEADQTMTRSAERMQANILKQIAPQGQRRRLFSAPMMSRIAASLIFACLLGVGVGELGPDFAGTQADPQDQLLFSLAAR